MISILLPIYNGIEFIKESIPTILYQTYKDWELIIGINGHPKESEIYKIAKEYEEKDSRITFLITLNISLWRMISIKQLSVLNQLIHIVTY